jgi:hypothetical protein
MMAFVSSIGRAALRRLKATWKVRTRVYIEEVGSLAGRGGKGPGIEERERGQK